MSAVVDSRVVEMRFDNAQFERGVKTSMSTLDKLKQKLNLSGAAKGLENVNAAAQKVNLNPLSNAVQSVGQKFSALEIMGVTALVNLTNSAVNAGKRIANALTLEPVTSGFHEYETQINAVQTILANTSSKGTTLEQVNSALDELNHYADKTIYNFTEMTRNIGTFTAAGVDLDTSVSAIKGIANLAAVSGSTSQQASTAMYQLSQALAAGTVKLMDWNSVVNAGMGGQVFQDALKETARVHGIAIDDMIKDEGSFRETLQKGWLTADVLTETLSKFTGDLSEEQLKSMGYAEDQIQAILTMGQTANDAATKVKTFTQLWDTLKEAAQSGWTQSWETIIGDFETAKERLTKLSDLFSDIINKAADRRNKMLSGAFTSKWDQLTTKLNDAGIDTEKFQNQVKALAKEHNVDLDSMIEKEGSFEKAVVKAMLRGKLDKSVIKDAVKAMVGLGDATGTSATQMEKYGEIVDKVINGNYGNGEERVRRLTEAGYDWATVQNLVNEKLGCSVRHVSDLTEEQLANADSLAKLSDEELINKGYTEDQIVALRDLQKAMEESGSSIDELIDGITKPSGGELLWDSFFTILDSITKACGAVRQAWMEAFHPGMTEDEVIEERSQKLYKLISAFHSLTLRFSVNDEVARKITRTFKGLFAVVDILTTIFGGGFKLALKIVSKVLQAFDLDILDVTAGVGDALVAFRDFLFDNDLINKGFELIASAITKVVEAVKALVGYIGGLEPVQKFLAKIKDTDWSNFIPNVIEAFKNVDYAELGRTIVENIGSGIQWGISNIPGMLVELGQTILSTIKEVLGIHSPSTETYDIGTNLVQGLINGVSDAASGLWETVKSFAGNIIEWFKGLDLNKVFAVGAAVGFIAIAKNISATIYKLADAFDSVSGILDSASEVMDNFNGVLEQFQKNMKARALDMKATAMLKMAAAIGILALSIVAIANVEDVGKLWNAVAIVTVLAAVLIGLAFAMDKMAKASVNINRNGVSISNLKTGLIAIGAALLMMAVIVKMVGGMDTQSAIQGFAGLTVMMLELVGFIAVFGLISKNNQNMQYADKFGKSVRKMATSLLIMAVVAKILSMMDPEDLVTGIVAMQAFIILFAEMAIVTGIAGPMGSKFGSTVNKLAISMLLMAVVAKILASMDPKDFVKGVLCMQAFVVLLAEMAIVQRLGGGKASKLGGTIMKLSIAMLLMAGTMKILGSMDSDSIANGIAAMQGFVLLIAELTLITRLAKTCKGAAATILAMSVAIGILAGVSIILGLIDPETIDNGIRAVAKLSVLIAIMTVAARGVEDIKGTMVGMAIAIGVMAAAVIALSFIDPKKLVAPTLAMSMLIGMLALVTKAAKDMRADLKGFAAIAIIIAEFAIILALMQDLPVESTLANAAALSSMLMALAGAISIIGKVDTVSKDSLIAVGIMAAVIGALAGVLYLLKGLPVGSTLATAAAISTILLALSASVLIISKTGEISNKALITVGIMTAIMAAVAGVLYLIQDLPVQSTLANAVALSVLMLALSTSCLAIAGASAIAGVASAGLVPLMTLIVGMGLLMAGIAALATEIPGLETFLQQALPILKLIGQGIGEFLGQIIVGIGEAVLSLLPALGESLSSFMKNIQPFLDYSADVDPKVLEGVGIMTAAILLLTAASFIEGIASILTAGNSFDMVGEKLESFSSSILPFLDAMKNVDSSAVDAAKNMAEVILALSVADFIDAINIFGSTSFDEFGPKLETFGDAIVAFSKAVSGKIDSESVEAAANAGKVLAELEGALTGHGGILQDIIGDSDLEEFGQKLTRFGFAIVAFSNTVKGRIDAESVEAAANAGKTLAELEGALTGHGGILQDIIGDSDLEEFGQKLTRFGFAIVAFSNTVKGRIDSESVEAAANAGETMAELESALPRSDGWAQAIMGKQDLSDFGEKILLFGEGLSGFYNSTANINTEKMSAVESLASRLIAMAWSCSTLNTDNIDKFTSVETIGESMARYDEWVKEINTDAVDVSVSSAVTLKQLVSSLSDLDTSGVTKFKSAILLGQMMRSYNTAIADIDSGKILGTIILIQQLRDLVDSMADINTEGVGAFKSAVEELGTVSIDEIADSFSGSSAKMNTAGIDLVNSVVEGMEARKARFNTTIGLMIKEGVDAITRKLSLYTNAGRTLVTTLVSAISSKASSISSILGSAVSSAASNVRSYYNRFYDAGMYLGSGLVIGINSKQQSVYNAGFRLGQKAVQGEMDGQKSRSPSKLTIQAGKWFGEGLVIGITSMGEKVYNAGHGIGELATQSVSQAISNVADIVANGLDSEPTIRPVVDLSDVTSGMDTLNSMWNSGVTLGAYGNLRDISNNMLRRQNGNSDVISAINKLGKDIIGSSGNTSYTINGITYDDGSNVADAVSALIRAARIERRI